MSLPPRQRALRGLGIGLLALVGLAPAFPGPASAPVDNPYFMSAKLEADVASISLAVGGTQRMVFDAGKAYAGRQYLIVGSATGTFPGTLWDGIQVPLNYDSYSAKLLEVYRKAPCVRFRGYLDAEGKAYPEIQVAKGSVQLDTGHTYYHAAVVWDSKSMLLELASNPVELLVQD